MLLLLIFIPIRFKEKNFLAMISIGWKEWTFLVIGSDTSADNKDYSQCSSVFHSYYNYESLLSHLSIQLFSVLMLTHSLYRGDDDQTSSGEDSKN